MNSNAAAPPRRAQAGGGTSSCPVGGVAIATSSITTTTNTAAITAVAPLQQVLRGRVAKWFDQRGFGFIQDLDTQQQQQQYFVHARDVIAAEGAQRAMHPGQIVEFAVAESESGRYAVRVSAPGGVPLRSAAPSAMAALPPAYSEAAASIMLHGGFSDGGLGSPAGKPSGSPSAATPATAATAPSNYSNSSSSISSSGSGGSSSSSPAVALPTRRFVGQIAHWTADRGFGFVAVPGQEDHYFTHIKDFTCEKPHMSPSMPVAGLQVEFTPSFVGSKKRASHVTLPNGIPFAPNAAASSTSPPSSHQQVAVPSAAATTVSPTAAAARAMGAFSVQSQQQEPSSSCWQAAPSRDSGGIVLFASPWQLPAL